jgi:hypothetical protein
MLDRSRMRLTWSSRSEYPSFRNLPWTRGQHLPLKCVASWVGILLPKKFINGLPNISEIYDILKWRVYDFSALDILPRL